MKSSSSKKILLPILFLLGITIFFFYKTFLHGLIPFPGDLLISEYKPWSSYSFSGYNPGSFPSKKQYFDTIRQIYPWRTLVTDQLKKGQLPLWNPYNFSGAPLLANVQSQVFYPLTIFYFILNQKIAWTILIMLQPFLACMFTFLYMKKLQTSTTGALLSAVAYGFSLFMTAFLEYNTLGHVMIWLPFLFLMVEFLIEKKKPAAAFGLVFGLVSAAFAGHLQLFGSLFLFLVVYSAFRITTQPKASFRQKQQNMLFLGLLMCLALGIAAVQFIPTAELLFLSGRADHNYTDLMNRLLIQPKQFFMAFSPDIFGNPATNNYLLHDSYPGKTVAIGIIPLFFAAFCLIQKKKDQIAKFFGVSIGFLLLIMFHSPVTQILYRFSIPFFSASAPTNNLFLTSFALAVLAGKGMDSWKKETVFPIKFLVCFVSIFLFAWGLYITKLMLIIPKNLFFSSAIVGTFILLLTVAHFSKKINHLLPYLFLLLTVGELWYFFQKFNPFVPSSFVYPETSIITWLKENQGVNRTWGYGAAEIQANYATQVGIYSPDGYDPLYPGYYGSFLNISHDGKLLNGFTDTTRSDATIAQGFGETDFATNQHRLAVLNLLGIKYILNRLENHADEKTFPPQTFSPVFTDNGWTVFDNKHALPRTFLTPSIAITPDLSLALSPGNATIRDYYPNSLRIITQATSSAILFLSDTYYPGWKATIDGKATPITKMDYAFRSVSVPPGNHTIFFTYEPNSIKYGEIISGISILALLGTMSWMTIKQR